MTAFAPPTADPHGLRAAARAAQLRRAAEHSADELMPLATATDRYADAAERARQEVAALNDRWEEAERRAARQAAAGQDVVGVATRTYDDGSAELAQDAAAGRAQDALLERLASAQVVGHSRTSHRHDAGLVLAPASRSTVRAALVEQLETP